MYKVQKRLFAIFLLSGILLANVSLYAATVVLRNGSFQSRGYKNKVRLEKLSKQIEKLRKNGWNCPDAKNWPRWWTAHGKNVKFDIFKKDGKQNDSYVKISGKKGYLIGYYGDLSKQCNYMVSFWCRGKGKARISFRAYGQEKKGTYYSIKPPRQFTVNVKSRVWVRYRHIIQKPEELRSLHLTVGVMEGAIDFDDIDLKPVEPGQEKLVLEEEKLYGRGMLIENMSFIQVDEVFKRRREEFQVAKEAFLAQAGRLDKKLVQSIKAELAVLEPYVLMKGLKTLQASSYNDMIVATRVLTRLAGKSLSPLSPVKAQPAKTAKDAMNYRAGFRPAHPGKITITKIATNKILYEENETASAKAFIVNKTPTDQKGTLIALMHLDFDTVREVSRKSVILSKNKIKIWDFNYNVGPETYGRGIEVQFVDETNKMVDSWQEFYHVAREWLRVFMARTTGYGNYKHYHASEPSTLGVHTTDAEVYFSAQTAYKVNQKARLRYRKGLQKRGIKSAFYQNEAFDAQLGYEEVRKHPDFILYDKNGQYAVDPVYGGNPNPMELASPVEIGLKRKVTKAYLDRIYTPGQTRIANFAREGVVQYTAKCIKKYAKENSFDGIYFDAAFTVKKGYGVDGKLNIPTNMKEIARLNGRIQDLYSKILKQDNPYFGTWCNFHPGAIEYRRRHNPTAVLGCGVGNDVGDEWIKALTRWKNVMCLTEVQRPFHPGNRMYRFPDKYLNTLLTNRDHIIQKYECNAVTGFINFPLDYKKPGPSKWGWPTINYFQSIITATQFHTIMLGPLQTQRPSRQFRTRYSRLIWARDIKIVPKNEVKKIINLKTPEKIWWKRFVYKRQTKEGYDLIFHLVRIPPTKKWDINWVNEPVPLEGVKITVNTGSGKVYDAQSMRPYYFEEQQQPVQTKLNPKLNNGKVSVNVPSFRYHTMVILRVKNK